MPGRGLYAASVDGLLNAVADVSLGSPTPQAAEFLFLYGLHGNEPPPSPEAHHAQELSESFRNVARHALPSIVSIETRARRLVVRMALVVQGALVTAAVVAAQGPHLAETVFCPPGAAVLELVGPANPRAPYWSLASCAWLKEDYDDEQLFRFGAGKQF